MPADAIFVPDGEGVFHVVNWRGRRHAAGPATLIRLSSRHLALLRALRRRGHPDAAIPDLLFLPLVSMDVLASIPEDPLPLLTQVAVPGRVASAPVAAEPAGVRPTATVPDTPLREAQARPGVVAWWGRRSRMSWLASGMLHAAVLLCCCSVAWVLHPPETPVPPVRMRAQATPTLRPTAPELPTDLTPALATNAPPAPVTAVSDLADGPTIEVDDSPDVVSSDVGSSIALTDTEVALPMLGAGAKRHASTFGPRGQLRRQAHLRAYGGSAASQTAVDAALRWFRRHQDVTGAWDPASYRYHCNESPKCEPGPVAVFRPLAESYTCALTGLAVLCYLGAGYDQSTPSQYQHTVHAAISYLLAHQPHNGYFGTSNYTHAIVTMALCEALAVAPDARLENACTLAVRALLAHQNREGGPNGTEVGYGQRSGWDYVGPSQRDDTSVTGWNIMALHSARAAGLEVGQGLVGATDWLDRTWKLCNPDWEQLEPSSETRFPYCVMRTGEPVLQIGPPTGQILDLAGVGAMAAAFLPHDLSTVQLQSLTRYIERVQTPSSWYNRYYLYYDTLALFQLGGDPWKRWNAVVMPLLIRTQRHAGCFAGSWDDGPGGFCRLFSTALCCLSLEVYYRYDRVGPQS